MAGGKGERLKPLTENRPKPLLNVGEKPIVQYNIERLQKFGVKNFTFCLNYLGEQIESYFGDGKDFDVEIDYLYEKDFLGTIGGITQKENFKYQDLLIINGDLLTTINFERFYHFFVEEDADLAVSTIPYQINLPFGILEIDDNQEVESIREKPSYTYYINTGIYLIKREMIELIPRNTKFDAIDLIESAMKKNCKVSSFPLLDYWVDIGQMEDYQKAQKDIKFLDL